NAVGDVGDEVGDGDGQFGLFGPRLQLGLLARDRHFPELAGGGVNHDGLQVDPLVAVVIFEVVVADDDYAVTSGLIGDLEAVLASYGIELEPGARAVLVGDELHVLRVSRLDRQGHEVGFRGRFASPTAD